MKNLLLIGILVLNQNGMAAESVTAEQIVAKADLVRNPKNPFSLENLLTEYDSGAVKSEMTLTVYSKEDKESGQFKNVVIYKTPARDAGKIVLLNGTTMWFYDPSSKSSVRISAQQRLVGQASEGDVVTVNFAKDYKSKIIDEMTIEDADHFKKNCWHLELTPARKDAIYGKIEYWVEKSTYRPIKGKFFSDSGRILKLAYFHKYANALGAERPLETIIIDAVNPKLVTTMGFSKFKERVVPDNWFQRDYLPHLKAD